ncbi:unnamed protein product [Rotaria sordida]|uniref:Uncharacterized protein n=1 Tax=Rotaria sordida TaxID=392033 RepID=A0A814CMU1_9BILA|nr:unnamed protein product [Rotaria sordida]
MAVSKERSSVRRKLALIIGNDNYKKPYNKLNYSLKNVKDLNAIESTALSEIRPPVGAFIQYACAANQTVKDVMKTDHNTEPQPDRLLDEPWNEKKEGNLESIKKKHAQVKAYYDSFPSIKNVIDDAKAEVQEAKTFTDSILKNLPSGNVTERDTACHVLKNLLKTHNIECLFYDSTHGKNLQDSSGILAEIASKARPFVLTLNSSKGLGGRKGPNTEHGAIRLVRTIAESVEKNESHPVLEDVINRLSEAHRTDKKNIFVTNVYVGSLNLAYIVRNYTLCGEESLQKLEQNLKDKFEQYNTVRLHPLLCRPAFDISFFDNKGNKTFPDSPITYQVGPLGRAQTYTSPAGWTRYGLKVLGKYSDGNYWLEPFQDPRNWYRAFHGTKRASEDDFKKSEESYEEQFAPVDAMASIYKTGFRSARVAAYGSGVYCSPDPIFPEVSYVKAVECDTQQGKKMFKCMLQVAVNPDGVNFTSDKSIWVVPNPEDIRPYGILIKDA